MSFTVIIPARHASSRLPGKPLADIGGKPMIQHVWERACSSSATEVIIATDHEDIVEAAKKFGADVFLTSVEHRSGTDRLQEICQIRAYDENHIVVNLQGDEPLFPPAQIDTLYQSICSNQSAGIATLCCEVTSWEQMFNPNVVKVVRDKNEFALYFSRAPIPWLRENRFEAGTFSSGDTRFSFEFSQPVPPDAFRHIGIYAYRVKVLNSFIQWPAGLLEQQESLEQLRAMENGVRIHCAVAECEIPEGVDTQDDLDRVRGMLV